MVFAGQSSYQMTANESRSTGYEYPHRNSSPTTVDSAMTLRYCIQVSTVGVNNEPGENTRPRNGFVLRDFVFTQ